MKSDYKEKMNYRKFTTEELERKLKEFKYQIVVAHAGGGKAKIDGMVERGSSGNDILKRLRKEKARILTILNEKTFSINKNEKKREDEKS